MEQSIVVSSASVTTGGISSTPLVEDQEDQLFTKDLEFNQ